MALVQRNISNKKQSVLTLALAGVLVITGLVAYFGIFNSAAPAPTTPGAIIPAAGGVKLQPVPTQSGLEAFIKLRATPEWQALKKFGNWPLASEPKGRSDPFIVPQATP